MKVKPSWIAKGEGRFCSIRCRSEWQRVTWKGAGNPRYSQVSRICETCGRSFGVPLSRVKAKVGRFCSNTCRGKGVGQFLRGSNAPKWAGGNLTVKCKECGKEFQARRYSVLSGRKKFCSRECCSQWRSKNLRGERNPLWRGGRVEYSQDFKEKRETIREREGRRCFLCQRHETATGKLDVHHIDYDKNNNSASNLVALCHSCHVKTNGKRIFWTGLLSRSMEAIYV